MLINSTSEGDLHCALSHVLFGFFFSFSFPKAYV
jgi:hypothetical protein